jgi:hypothetical protein
MSLREPRPENRSPCKGSTNHRSRAPRDLPSPQATVRSESWFVTVDNKPAFASRLARYLAGTEPDSPSGSVTRWAPCVQDGCSPTWQQNSGFPVGARARPSAVGLLISQVCRTGTWAIGSHLEGVGQVGTELPVDHRRYPASAIPTTAPSQSEGTTLRDPQRRWPS